MPDEKPLNIDVTATLVGWRDRRGRFAKLSDDLRARQRQIAKDAIGDLKDHAVSLSPTGKHPFGTPQGYVAFKKAWKTDYHETDTGAQSRLYNESDHAGVVMFRTPPHPIAAKKAHVLRWMGGDGQVHFASNVLHPGTAGNPVLEKVNEQKSTSLQSALQKAAVTAASDLRLIFE